jgi:tRNA nucleotidyltransferase (CCA-adding enzyme)
MRATRKRLPRLPSTQAGRLALARRIARREGWRLFLVGGAVRDLFLGLPVRDLDFAVEGDAGELARKVGEALGAPTRVHGRFGTATVELGEGERLDFAATRRETYQRPGALPRVGRATIEEDLSRRDFTVNAMAMEIAPALRAQVYDPFDGREDLARRQLRALHARSFWDDPTRAYRAARYANRLGFAVEPETRREALRSVEGGAFDAISGDRRRREIRLLLSEPNRAGALRWMIRLDLPRTIHPALPTSAQCLASFRSAERLAARGEGPTSWFLYLLVWSAKLREVETAQLADRLSLAGEDRRVLCSWPETLARLSRSSRPTSLSAIADLRLSGDQLAAAAVFSAPGRARNHLLAILAHPPLELAIRGRDLVRAGISPGPAVGKALARTLIARRDGMIPPERELEFALEAARREFP